LKRGPFERAEKATGQRRVSGDFSFSSWFSYTKKDWSAGVFLGRKVVLKRVANRRERGDELHCPGLSAPRFGTKRGGGGRKKTVKKEKKAGTFRTKVG